MAVLTLVGSRVARSEEVFTEVARDLLVALHREFHIPRLTLLANRRRQVDVLAAGGSLDFLEETAALREDAAWRVAPPAPALASRQVEFTGPADPDTTAQALNSDADVWVADFEDAISPTWANLVQGQLSLRDAAIGRSVNGSRPTIMVKPRAWHLPEKHVLVDGEPVSGSLVDFGLYLAHASAHVWEGSGPYFCLPKIASHLEARLWNDVFVRAEEFVGIPPGSIKATAIIETVPAVFEMEEILYELRDHSAGLSVGQSDLIFSIIKSFRSRGKEFVLPHRHDLSMASPFMQAYADLLVQTCHKRGAQAIGAIASLGSASSKSGADKAELDAVRVAKTREAAGGFDGSQVASSDLVTICRNAFSDVRAVDAPSGNGRIGQLSAAELLEIPSGSAEITESDLRDNISFGIRYLGSWLRGTGAMADKNVLGSAATAEIARSQVWQWLHHGVALSDGTSITAELVERVINEELAAIVSDIGSARSERESWHLAEHIFTQLVLSSEYVEFFTLLAYPYLP
jgi:malate synthase